MSILIKVLKKPVTCDDCIVPMSKCDFLMKRSDECSLIELPEKHGRLIDANVLIEELKGCHLPGAPYVDAGISIAIGKVCDAPTIIEAEEEEDA